MPLEKQGKGTAPAGMPGISAAKDGFGPEGRKKLKNAGVPMKPILGEEQFVEPGCPCASTPGIIRRMLELPSGRQENAAPLDGTPWKMAKPLRVGREPCTLPQAGA